MTDEEVKRRLAALEAKERSRQQTHENVVFYGLFGLAALLWWKAMR